MVYFKNSPGGMSSDSPRGPHSKTVYFWHYVPTCGASTELMSTCFTYESGTLNDTKTLLYHICQFDLDDVTLDEKGFFLQLFSITGGWPLNVQNFVIW